MTRFTKTLVAVKKKLKWPEKNSVGYEGLDRRDKYLNPLLTPPPRSPKSPEDFRHPQRLGHWTPFGNDFTNPVVDRYKYHEFLAIIFIFGSLTIWAFRYGPDYKLRDWARREAFLRTHKREALGLPLIDKDFVDPERIVLPTEEELESFPVTL